MVALILLGLATEAIYVFAMLRPWWLWDHFWTDPYFGLLTSAHNIARYVMALVGVFALYSAVAFLTWRGKLRVPEWLVWTFPVVFSTTLVLAQPAMARDLYHYIMEGRILWHYGGNPLVDVPYQYPSDPFLPVLDRWQLHYATPYGPIWLLLTWLPQTLVGNHPEELLIAYKVLSLVFLFGTAYVVRMIVREVHPGHERLGVILLLWNPMILISVALNGHNDSVMMFFALLAVYFAIKRRWSLAMPLLMLSVLTKYVTVLLLPVFLVYALSHGRKERKDVAIGTLVAGVIAFAFMAPFWEGFNTFGAYRDSQSSWFINSMPELMTRTLDGAFGRSTARIIARGISLAMFAPLYGLVLWRLRKGAGFLLSSYQVMFVYLLVGSTLIYPWYATWILPLGILVMGPWAMTAVLLSFTICSTDVIQHVVRDLGLLQRRMGLEALVAVIVVVLPPMLFAAHIVLERVPLRWPRSLPRPQPLAAPDPSETPVD